MTAPQPSPPQPQRWSLAQVLQAAAAAVLAGTVMGTAAGVRWLVTELPSKLNQIEARIDQVVNNQNRVDQNLKILEGRVMDHDRRIIRLEVGP